MLLQRKATQAHIHRGRRQADRKQGMLWFVEVILPSLGNTDRQTDREVDKQRVQCMQMLTDGHQNKCCSNSRILSEFNYTGIIQKHASCLRWRHRPISFSFSVLVSCLGPNIASFITHHIISWTEWETSAGWFSACWQYQAVPSFELYAVFCTKITFISRATPNLTWSSGGKRTWEDGGGMEIHYVAMDT